MNIRLLFIYLGLLCIPFAGKAMDNIETEGLLYGGINYEVTYGGDGLKAIQKIIEQDTNLQSVLAAHKNQLINVNKDIVLVPVPLLNNLQSLYSFMAARVVPKYVPLGEYPTEKQIRNIKNEIDSRPLFTKKQLIAGATVIATAGIGLGVGGVLLYQHCKKIN